MSPIVADSFADTRARRSVGIAMAAMMPMIATTISSSIRVKPFWFFIRFNLPFAKPFLAGASDEQVACHGIARCQVVIQINTH